MDRSSLWPSFVATAALLALGVTSGDPAVGALAVLKDNGMSRLDVERMERGYYETILDAGRSLDRPAHEPVGHHQNHADVPFNAGVLAQVVPDVREFVLKPNLVAELRGGRWSTNTFAMRDRAYSRAKPSNVRRIAFVGDSIGAGWGVNDGQGFEPTLERALDSESHVAGGPAVEILNFAVPGHAPGQRWEDFRRAGGWEFAPDLVLYQATPADPGWDERRLRALLARGINADLPVYHDVLARAGVRPGGDLDTYKRALRPYREAILSGVYRTIAADCRLRGVPCVWVLIPRVGRPAAPGEKAQLIALARAAGFTAAIDLTDAYAGLDPAGLAIRPDDFHPNAQGHARLAARLREELARRPELTRAWLGPGPVAGRTVDSHTEGRR